MPDEPPDRPVTTAARVRHVLGQLLGPWGWWLAAVGLLLCLFPGPHYRFPPDCPTASRLNAIYPGSDAPSGGGRRPPPPAVERPTLAIWAGTASQIDGPGLSARYSAEHPPGDGLPDLYVDPADSQTGWSRVWGEGVWGLSLQRFYDADDDTWGGGLPLGRLWRTATAAASLLWLAALPAGWTLVRVLAAFHAGWGEPVPAGRIRRVLRPWAAFAACVAAGSLLTSGETSPGRAFGSTTLLCEVRRDPFADWHPRFLRISIERPLRPGPVPPGLDYPADPPLGGAFGSRRWGFELERLNGHHGAVLRWDSQTDGPGKHRQLVSLDLSLWYVLLPAALWSGVSLWRSRGGRMRPA